MFYKPLKHNNVHNAFSTVVYAKDTCSLLMREMSKQQFVRLEIVRITANDSYKYFFIHRLTKLDPETRERFLTFWDNFLMPLEYDGINYDIYESGARLDEIWIEIELPIE